MSASTPATNVAVPDVDEVSRTAEPLLRAAFEPAALPRAAIPRPALLEALTSSVRDKPLTLLSAPAGSGKTVLVSSWASSRTVPWPIVWLTVDDVADQPGFFWPYLIEAMTRSAIRLPHVEPPRAGARVSTSFLVRLAADINELPEPLVLVLDGSDRTLSSDTDEGLDFLIRHASSRLRVVICGRSDPMLPLHRYRLSESMAELRVDDLAFSAAEARALFASLRITVPSEVITTLTELTEGWAAGLRLAANSIEQGSEPAKLVADLKRGEGSVAEYLMAEVLNGQPRHARRLLLRTSVAEEVWPALADCLTGRTDGRRILTDLSHANAFVQRPPHPDGPYRVHPLFRELLRAQLHYEMPSDVPRLQRKCATWYAAAGQYVRAAQYAVESGDAEYAAAILVDSLAVGSLLAQDNSSYAEVVKTVINDAAGPEAAVLKAAQTVRDEAIVPGHDAERIAALAEAQSNTLAMRVSASLVHAAIISSEDFSGDAGLAAADRAQSLLAKLPEDELSRRPELTAIVEVARASAVMLGTQEPSAAAEAFLPALAASDVAGASRLQRRAMAAMALLEALRGRLGRAAQLGARAEQLADAGTVPRTQRPASAALALAWVNCEQAQQSQARHWLAQAQQSANSQNGRIVKPMLALLNARWLRSRNELIAAESALLPFLNRPRTPPWVHARVLLEAAELHLARSQPAEAVRIVDALPDPHLHRAELIRGRAAEIGARSPFQARSVAEEHTAPVDVRIEAWIARANGHLGPGDTALAVEAVSNALELAKPEHIRRPFLDSNPQLRKLLRGNLAAKDTSWLSVSATNATQPSRRRTREVKSVERSNSGAVIIEELSERETEVLRLLAELLSTEEIGAALFVSVNTVRTHVRSILRKLAVSHRNEAVRRARELSLV